jgi:hypothetical protein
MANRNKKSNPFVVWLLVIVIPLGVKYYMERRAAERAAQRQEHYMFTGEWRP